MNAPFAALAWEYMRRARRNFLMALAWMAVTTLWLGSVFLDETRAGGTSAKGLALITFTQLLIAICLLVPAQVEQRGKDNPMMPARWKLLPVSTPFLVTAQTVFGVTAMLVLFALVNFPITGWVFGLWLPWQIAMFYATVMVVAQALAWGMGGFVLGRLLAVGLVGSLLFGFFTDLIWWAALHDQLSARPQVTMAVLIAAAFGLSLLGVGLDRRGIRWPGMGAVCDGLIRRFRPRQDAGLRPFSSGQAAQFWLEWRTRGIHLPLVAGLLGLFIVVTRWFVGPATETDTLFFALFYWCFPLVSYGVGLTAAGTWRGKRVRRDLGGFAAAQPLDTSEMGSALLRVSLGSVVVSVTILAFCCVAAVDLVARNIGLSGADTGGRILTVSGIVAAVACVTWLLYMLGLATAITGRGWVAGMTGFAVLAVPVALLIASVWIGKYHERLGHLVAQSSGAWLATAAVAGLIAVYGTALRLRLVRIPASVAAGLVAAGLSVTVARMLFRLDPDAGILGLTLSISAAALIVLPFASIPTALHWNRHR